MTEQAVITDTDVEATPSTEASDAQDTDLDSLLSEFDSETKDQSEQSDKGSEQPTGLEDEDKAFLQNLKAQESRRQIDEEITKMKSTLPEDVFIPDKAFRGMVEYMASENPKIANAFANRSKNPEAWAAVSKKLGADIAKEFQSQPDKKSTSDREAVIAAVKSVSTSSQETAMPKFSEMSDAQFNEWRRKQ